MVIQIAGRVIAVLIGLFSIAILTRYLTTEQFGEYTTTVTFLQFFGVLVDFGLTLTLVVMISEQGADEKKIVGNLLSLRLLIGAILFALAPLLVLLFPWSETVKMAVLFGAIGYWLMGGASLLVGVFQKHACMWRAAVAELLNRTVLVLFILFFVFLHLGVVAMVTTTIAASGAWLLFLILFAKPFVQIRPRFDWMVWKRAFSKSWPIAISILFNLMYLKGDILFLSLYRPQTDVALYGATYRILDVMTALPTMFMGLLLPTLVATWSAGKKGEFKQHLTRAFDLFMITLFPIIVGAQIVGTPLMIFIAGKNYEASGVILQLLILAVAGVFFGALFGHTVVAINKQRLMTLGYALVAILSVVGYFWLIPPYGIWGAVWVTLFSEGMIALLTFLVVWKTTRILPNLVVTGKALLASFVMFFFLLSFPSIHVLIDVLLGALIYLVVMIMIKGIRASEIRTLLPNRFVRIPRE